MIFENGESSPFYELEDSDADIYVSLEIDTTREIKAVSMGLRGGLVYTGISFYDDSGEVIAFLKWSDDELAKETPSYQIPDGQHIVGFKCSTGTKNFAHLAFLLAVKNENEVVGEIRIPPIEEYPTINDFETLYASSFVLSAINYKQFSDFYSLSGIQLAFSNGISTPLFETSATYWDELKNVEVDTTRTIRYISLRFNSVAYEGLRLYDEQKDYILDLTWHESPKGGWSDL